MRLAMFDISGIQRFIFSTNRLREIVGASTLVQNALEQLLPEALAQVLGRGFADWQDEGPFVWDGDSGKAKIVYIGGGNALVVFSDEDSEQQAVRKLQELVFLATAGGLRLCVASCEAKHDDSYDKIQRELTQKMNRHKQDAPVASTLKGFSINALDNDTYEPILKLRNLFPDSEDTQSVDRYTTASRYSKQAAFVSDTRYASNAEKDFYPKDSESRKRFLAVIHIDGNSMGQQIIEFSKKLPQDDLPSALTAIRSLSKEISHTYKNVIATVERTLWPDSDVKKIPFRPIIANGDDVTVICRSCDAFKYAQAFVEALDNTTNRTSNYLRYSVGIGVAFVNLGFPFSTAYNIAEELCQSAKGLALNSGFSSIDFQICYGGLTGSVEQFRKRNYRFMREGRIYCLERRPYQFGCADEGNDYFNNFEKPYMELSKNGGIARNKLKALRDAYSKGVAAAESKGDFLIARESSSQAKQLAKPFYDDGGGIFKAGFFDILDVMDMREGEDTCV